MKVILDTCVWGGALAPLRAAGHDVIWIGEWQKDPGDDEILALAYRENRVLVTLDKDFGELAVMRKIPHCGIIRLVNMSAKQQAKVCLQILATYEKELRAEAIITVEQGWIRIRLPEPKL